MRSAFALLVLALLAVTVWTLWDDAFPKWRRYQEELVRRETDRLERELAQARSELERPELRAELERIDVRLREFRADTTASTARLSAVQTRLQEIEEEVDEIRGELRLADRRLREPETTRLHREVTDALDRVRAAYAAESGSWPPDTLRLGRLWAIRDSLGDRLVAIEGPVREWRALLEEKQGEARMLRLEALELTSVRDSLETVRSRLLEPVATRESALARLRNRRIRIREIVSPGRSEVARCPTCHGTLDDPPGVHPPLPAMEVFRDVPCTVCHRGSGRALSVMDAHRGLLTAAGFGAGPRSFRARIEELSSPDPAVREVARDELRRITGIDPALERSGEREVADEDSAAAAAWAEWWLTAEAYFEPGDREGDEPDESALLMAGIDPWIFSVRGRPLRYVGSGKCLGCHEVQHREHSRRWLATKFRSIERLADEVDPTPCLPCHSTGYDSTAGTYAEPGVTCEGCHGPGERYNEMMLVGEELLGKGDEARGNALLAHSSRLAREAVSRRNVPGEAGDINVCVKCHHPRRHRDGGPSVLERAPTDAPGG